MQKKIIFKLIQTFVNDNVEIRLKENNLQTKLFNLTKVEQRSQNQREINEKGWMDILCPLFYHCVNHNP